MMKTIRFNPEGGRLEVEVRGGFAQPGSYDVLLWEANANAIVWQQRGNFINTADDRYELPLAAATHDGRLLDCLATLVITPPLNQYRLVLLIHQDGAEIGAESVEGESDQPAVTVELFVQLEGDDGD